MKLRLGLRESSLVLTIFAVLGAGMLASACGTVAGASQDKAGNMRAWLQYRLRLQWVRTNPDPALMRC
jgi:predicted small secreted protein